jgi:hypothetical protein
LASTPSQLPKPALHVPMPQTPVTHAGVALAKEQALAHAPQLAASVWRFTHTLAQLVSVPQSRVQTPMLQRKPAAQAFPQRPQFAAAVLRLASQPFEATPSQLAKPAAHAPTAHAPPTHVDVALASEHAAPHAPQWATEVVVFVSQPLVITPSQLPKPALHAMPQAPDPHDATPLVALHAAMHAPQFADDALVFVSQPFEAAPSQLPKPAVHVPTAQAPPTHVDVALASEHAAPHAPQLDAVVRRSVSHPLVTRPSQLPKPALHAMPQRPAAHDATPLVALHAAPHAPQCDVDVRRFTSQPFSAMPSQSAKPALHARPHPPRAQVGVALARAGHTVAQAPQFDVSVWRFTQRPAQKVVGGPHTLAQTPLEHTRPAPQAFPQAPQSPVAVWRSISQPLVLTRSQSPQPASHAATAQRLPEHAGVACESEHAAPQAPQWAVALRRSVSQPFAATPSQSP